MENEKICKNCKYWLNIKDVLTEFCINKNSPAKWRRARPNFGCILWEKKNQ